MASVRRKPNSQFWYACFTLPDGTRVQRSTKTEKRSAALEIARDYERVTKTSRTETQVRKVIGEIYERVSGQPLGSSTVRKFFDEWITSKKSEVGATSFPGYHSMAKEFMEFLGSDADGEMMNLKTNHISAFRNDLAGRLSASSVNQKLKILRSVLKQAWMEGLITENPAGRVANIRAKEKPVERRAFTVGELRRLLSGTRGEWTGMVLFGIYTGQRLGDIATLQWQNIDLERSELHFTTEKTNRRQILPLAAPLRALVDSLPEDDRRPKSYLFPRAAGVVVKTGRTGNLSNQFRQIMASVGLVEHRSHEKAKEGRQAKRSASELSFHSLRHTATSMMKNAGVSPAIVQEFVGHDSKAVSQNYTHIELEALKKAADSLPDLLGDVLGDTEP